MIKKTMTIAFSSPFPLRGEEKVERAYE